MLIVRQSRSGQHTYSEIPRVSLFFRLFGVLGLIGLGLSIAGGILGSPVAPANANIGVILRRTGACVYGGVYVLLLAAFFGTFSYRWHLRSYRRNVSTSRPQHRIYSYINILSSSVALGYRHCIPLLRCPNCIWNYGGLVCIKHQRHRTIHEPHPCENESCQWGLDILPRPWVGCGVCCCCNVPHRKHTHGSKTSLKRTTWTLDLTTRLWYE